MFHSRKITQIIIFILVGLALWGSTIVSADAPEFFIHTIAGTTYGFSGDGDPATTAQIEPIDTAVDSLGNIYIADTGNQRIRKIIAATGVITTIAGTGTFGFSGDGGPAINATFWSPVNIAVDSNDNLYIADYSNHRIRKIIAATGIITTIAGTGTAGFSGDGGSAINAQLDSPYSIAVNINGDIYIGDATHRIRKIIAATGVITTIAGTGTFGFSGDGGPATRAEIGIAHSIAIDSSGDIYFSSAENSRVRKIIAATGIITTVAGSGFSSGSSGDGGVATNAQLYIPTSIVFDGEGNLFIADEGNHRIRMVSTATGIITTVAGTGTPGFSGDGGLAQFAQLKSPTGLSSAPNKTQLYVADAGNVRIRSLTPVVRKIYLPLMLKF